MLGYGSGKLGTCLFKQLGPFIGVELLPLEHRYEILIAKLILMAEALLVILEEVSPRSIFIYIHPPRIPFMAEGGHRVSAPVGVDAELGILEPFGHRILS